MRPVCDDCLAPWTDGHQCHPADVRRLCTVCDAEYLLEWSLAVDHPAARWDLGPIEYHSCSQRCASTLWGWRQDSRMRDRAKDLERALAKAEAKGRRLCRAMTSTHGDRCHNLALLAHDRCVSHDTSMRFAVEYARHLAEMAVGDWHDDRAETARDAVVAAYRRVAVVDLVADQMMKDLSGRRDEARAEIISR